MDEKYYLSQEKVKRLIEDMEDRKALLFEPDEEALKRWRENSLQWWGRSMNRENMHRQGEYILRKDAALHLQRVPEETSSQRLSGLAA